MWRTPCIICSLVPRHDTSDIWTKLLYSANAVRWLVVGFVGFFSLIVKGFGVEIQTCILIFGVSFLLMHYLSSL